MPLSADAPVESVPLAGPVPAARGGGGRFVAAGFVLAVVLAGAVLRFLSSGPLWLDEAQSVAIARRSLPRLFELLRHDGSPPLYYLLLHYWIGALGTGTFAVRALSAVLSVATLPLLWLLATRLLDRAYAALAVVLLASSPFAIRYASETRMYALVVLLTALGGLALLSTLRSASARAAAGLALVTAALLLTHYWAVFLIGATLAGLLPGALRRRRGHLVALAGIAAGGVPVLPWVPALLFQLRHTGTPWAKPRWRDIAPALRDWAGGASRIADVLAALLLCLTVAGLVAARRTGIVGRRTGALAAGTIAVATAASLLTGGALMSRYTSVAVVPFVLVTAAGARAGRRRYAALTAAATVAVAGLGLAQGARQAGHPRSSADKIAAELAQADPARDVAVICPDQLGPDTYRLVTDGLRLVTYPTGAAAEWVDWVDYKRRAQSEQPAAYAGRLVAGLPRGGAVWVVMEFHDPAYPGSCGPLLPELAGRLGLPSAGLITEGLSGGSVYVLRYPPARR
ncbi:MAG: glycosyltransferase family 39 protein [Frankiaceae bacterium]